MKLTKADEAQLIKILQIQLEKTKKHVEDMRRTLVEVEKITAKYETPPVTDPENWKWDE